MSDESRPEAPSDAPPGPSSTAHPTAPSTAPSDGPKRRGKVARKHTVGRVVLISALTLALVTALSVVYFVRHLNGNIEGVSIGDVLSEEDRPQEVYKGNGEPLDILVMGSDSRDCEGCDIDQEGGGGSDTSILVHISADRSRAYAVSIPRDSIVDRPDNDACTTGGTDVMWNAAYDNGGPLCTMSQLEQMTGIRVEHFVVVDFGSFGKMVDAVGGVPVCVPEDIVDRKHQIFVPKGNPSLLTGDEALDYVRARYVGELIQQNDISRIRRQQEFIGALVREVKSAGTLTRPDKVVKFLNAATNALTTDDEFADVTKIARVALQLQNIGLDKVQFITLPTEYYPRDSEFFGRVRWTDQATEIWKLLTEDKVLPKSLIGDTSVSAEGPPGSTETPTAGESGTGTPSGTPSSTPSETTSETPSTPTETASESPSPATPSETTAPEEDPVPGVCS
ncbi:LCP family protein [Nocardioides KLBMP 9356]|uniref:LCP family protein n=1 Tax=Nocardioides potassii TaxID=2911371 RepID=A0ABS9H514_9ACTN|nr:LCP family protein [Nocardioides potassii]MCF6376350.1 LCP family protein [Nocardioides potassii]